MNIDDHNDFHFFSSNIIIVFISQFQSSNIKHCLSE